MEIQNSLVRHSLKLTQICKDFFFKSIIPNDLFKSFLNVEKVKMSLLELHQLLFITEFKISYINPIKFYTFSYFCFICPIMLV